MKISAENTRPLHGRTLSGREGPREQKILRGVGVGPGVAIGVAFVHDSGEVRAPEYRISLAKIESEKQRFGEAVAAAHRQIGVLRERAERMPGQAGEELGYLLDAYAHMLKGSRLIRGVEARIETERINAEAAVRKEIGELLEAFAAMGDPYLSGRMEDIREVGQRLVRNLTKTPHKALAHIPRNAVVVSADLTPADTVMFDNKLVGAFVTETGGVQSHTAIMARSLGLTAVLATPGLRRAVRVGDLIIVDGLEGRVIVNPRPDTLATYRKKRADFLRARRALTRLRDLPATTVDGHRVTLLANVELPAEVEAVRAAGAEGIGLFRSEFLFMNRSDWPSEDEQADVLRKIVESSAGHPVTVRVLDAGGDKLPSVFAGRTPANPALGLRAVRFLLTEHEVLETQLAAILRAAAGGPVRILVPMVASLEEMVEVRATLERVHRRLRRQKLDCAKTAPPLGAMIEIPSAAIAADTLAQVCDFFSIGTNDLTQYTLAIDRADSSVSHLYNPVHPAVLRLIQFTTGAALRQGIPVGVCGEIAGDARLTPLLLGLGIRELSMAASSIPRVKQRIRKLSLFEAEQHARAIMSETTPKRIDELLDQYA